MKRTFAFVLGMLVSVLFAVSCQKEQTFYVTTSVSPEAAGTVSPASCEMPEGSTVTFRATANGEYVFNGWSGSISGNDNPVSAVVTSDMNVKANFILRTYPLSLAVDGEGSILEKVISAKSEYSSGTIVELTAVPALHWQFSHWEGDLTGTENPKQITVASAKSVKAVFIKKSYEYNLKIVGPGAVDEEVVQDTKATLEAGTIVRLSAFPDSRTNSIFTGWSGDITGTDPVIEVNIDDVKNITATFSTSPAKQYPLPDLKQPSIMLKNLYYGVDFSFAGTGGHYFLATDYNRDGYVDCITLEGSPDGIQIYNIGFYLGQSDGSFIIDEKNHNRILGQIHSRKQIYGDYNNDGLPDICLIGHGWDYEPWPGEYPVILMSSSSGTYKDIRLTQYVSFYHGGASADIDNDGDLDIFLIASSHGDPVLLLNDGVGNFTKSEDMSIYPYNIHMYYAELYDIDKDGYIDLLINGSDHEGYFPYEEPVTYKNMPLVFWGNGKPYSQENSTTRLPKTPKNGFGLAGDVEFYDLDSDGIDEIIISRTGDGVLDKDIPNYKGYAIQVIKRIGREFIDITSEVFNGNDFYNIDTDWLVWIDIDEIDGNKYLIGRTQANGVIYYELINGKFVKHTSTSDFIKQKHGFVLYSDNVSMWDKYIDGAYTEDKFSGTTSMKFSNWPQWSGFALDYPTWVDFSYLEQNGYCLEFAIKNTDPDLVIAFAFETRIQTEPWYFPSYSYTFNGNEHKLDGTWDVIKIPLSSLKCDDEWTGYYWNTIKTINILPNEYHGKDFYLDEIRIRKAL